MLSQIRRSRTRNGSRERVPEQSVNGEPLKFPVNVWRGPGNDWSTRGTGRHSILNRRSALFHWLRRRPAKAGAILLYHRITELSSDPWELCVSPRNFREQMQVLRETCSPVSLLDLSAVFQRKRTPRLPVVVTFDDGYVDILDQAMPVLRESEIPTTFFLTTGCFDQPREFWWDELDRVFLQPGSLPASLRLRLDAGSETWDLSDATDYTAEQADQHRRWCAWEQPPTARHAVYYDVLQRLYALPSEKRQSVLDEILGWAGMERAERSTHRRLSPTEIVALSRCRLVEIGAHTISHPALPSLDRAAQRSEIDRSKSILEDLVGHPVTSFAYPHGDCSEETARSVQEAGFVRACTTRSSLVWKDHDRFQLPRYYVGNWDGAEFAERISMLQDSRMRFGVGKCLHPGRSGATPVRPVQTAFRTGEAA